MKPKTPSEDLIYGRRPVQEALQASRILKLFIASGSRGGGIEELVELAKKKKIPFHWIDRFQIDQMVQGHHQGVVAQMAPISFHRLSDLIESARVSTQKGAVLLFLDSIQDPQNVGSILRSAYYFGVKGVVIPKWRAASVTGAVLRASAGAAAFIPIAQVSNLATAIEETKKKGIWVVGADMVGTDVKVADVPRPFALVLGSEGEGLHDLIKRKCDLIVKLTKVSQGDAIDSLNVSAATSALLHFLS